MFQIGKKNKNVFGEMMKTIIMSNQTPEQKQLQQILRWSCILLSAIRGRVETESPKVELGDQIQGIKSMQGACGEAEIACAPCLARSITVI